MTRWRLLTWVIVLACLVVLAIPLLGLPTLLLVFVWHHADANVAGWITFFIVAAIAGVVASLAGLEQAWARASRRARWVVVVVALVISVDGDAAYVLWPGTASWYLCTLPWIPALIVLVFMGGSDGDARGGDSFEGPWTAP